MTPSNDKELIIDDNRRMKPSCTRPGFIFINWDFHPAKIFEIEEPEIVKVSYSFTSKDY